MIENIGETDTYKSLELDKNLMHAYLLYSSDRELNNNVALFFAKSLVCENHTACNECSACQQFSSPSHPDVNIIVQDSIKVEDVNNLFSKLNTLPISSDKKVFVILNAENINEISQNKLLKSLEEPNENNIFILTTTKTDKILTTVMSRVKKVYVPSLNHEDKVTIANYLLKKNIDIQNYVNADFSLTEILNLATDSKYKKTIEDIYQLFLNLNSSQDIPRVVNNLTNTDKQLFYPCLQDIILNCLDPKERKFDRKLLELINSKYPQKALLKCLPLIENAYKKYSANVNFFYCLDNLLFNMLKEKYLCS